LHNGYLNIFFGVVLSQSMVSDSQLSSLYCVVSLCACRLYIKRMYDDQYVY